MDSEKIVDIYWGNSSFAIKIAESVKFYDACKIVLEWMNENDHYFHTEHIHYWRMWGEDYITMDYGSHTHFAYVFPAKYPYLRDYHGVIPYEDPGASFEDEIPMGWRRLFREMCDDINAVLDHFEVSREAFHFLQVKEKFGAVRCYWTVDAPDLDKEVFKDCYCQIDKAIEKCEHISSETCHICGKRAYVQSHGWVLPYCLTCAENYWQNHNKLNKEDFSIAAYFSPITE
jgi:hypothetical protein